MKKSLILAGMLSIGYAYAQEERVGINTESPTATLNVKTTNDTKSPKNLELENQVGTKLVTVLNTGKVGIGTDTPTERVSVLGGKISVSGDGTYTGYLEDVHLKFNRPTEAYLSNINPSGKLAFMTGGTTEQPENIRMTIHDTGNVSIGLRNSITKLALKGKSNYGVMRVISNSANEESTIGYQIYTKDSENTWITGVNPVLGDGFIIAKGGSPRIFVTDNGVGIGTVTPTHKLHIKADADPLKLEGLQEGTGSTLVVDANGVVKKGSATSTTATNGVQTDATMVCNDTNLGKINFGNVTIDGKNTQAFGFCMKNSDGEAKWFYIYGGAATTSGAVNGTFGS